MLGGVPGLRARFCQFFGVCVVVVFLGSFLGRFGVSFWGVFWSRWALFLFLFRSLSYAVVSRISEAPLDFGVIFGFVEPKAASK